MVNRVVCRHHVSSQRRGAGRALRAYLVIAALSSASTARALAPDKPPTDCRIDVWSNRDGLPGAWVRGLVQGPQGHLWIGTYGGVARYDGSRVRRVPEGGPPIDVSGVAGAADGTIVIASGRDLLCVQGSGLVSCAPSSELAEDERISAISTGADGHVWIGTNHRVLRLVKDRLLPHRPELALPFDRVTVLHRDRSGRLWVGGPTGLVVDDGKGYRLVQGRGTVGAGLGSAILMGAGLGSPLGTGAPAAAAVHAIHETAAGHLWILTDHQLLRFEAGELVAWYNEARAFRGVNSRMVEDRDGNLWITTAGGLIRLRAGQFQTFGQKDGLPDDDVTAILEDREGSLWVGTRNGLAQLSDRTLATQVGPPGLRDQPVEAVAESSDGTFWFGSYRGLTRWKYGVERLYTQDDGLPINQVYALAPGEGDELFIGTRFGLVRWRHGRIEPTVLHPERIMTLLREPAGRLWIGTAEGVFRRDGDQTTPIVTEGFVPGQIRGIELDPAGGIWVSGSGGLGRVQGDRLRPAVPDGSPGARAGRGIRRDEGGTLWMAEGTQLVGMKDGVAKVYGKEQGIDLDWVCQILPDDFGSLWIATMNRIARVSRAELAAVAAGKAARVNAIAFDSTDRRQEPSAQRARTAGAWKARDGRLWFATLRGVVTIDPRRVRINLLPPTVVIEGVTVDGRTVSTEGSGQFAPGAGRVELQFAAISLVEPNQVRARYMLEGLDDRWTEAGARRTALYTNVPPGRYRFRVQASNADGIWNEAGASFDLSLARRFHQTFWFYLLVAAFLAAVVWTSYRLRLSQLRGRYLAVFAERSRVARELHDRLLQGMSAVALELSNIRRKLPGAPEEAARRLEVTERAVAESLEETRRYVLDLRDQASGTVELAQAIGRMAQRIGNARGGACELAVSGEARPLSREAHGALYAIAQEAVTNAFSHAAPRRVDVRLRYQVGDVTLEIADDGRGFDPAHAPGTREGHFGLAGMRERTRLLGGEIRIDSEAGAGTIVAVTVPASAERPHV